MNRIIFEDQVSADAVATDGPACVSQARRSSATRIRSGVSALGRYVALCALLSIPGAVFATCTGTVSTTPFSPASVTINKNTPVGQVVSSATVTLNVVCDGTSANGERGWRMNYTPQAPLVATSLGQGTFATSMAGLGFRMYTNVGGLIAPTSYGTNGGDNFYPGGWGPGGYAALISNTTYTFRLDLVRTDTSLKSGSFSDSLIRFGYQYWKSGYCPEGKDCTRQFGNQVTTPVDFQFVDPTCSITTGSANQTVVLDDAAATELPATGSTARPKDFNVSFDKCTAATAVRLRMDGTAAAPTVLANAGSAAGVGVQLLFKGAPLPLNTTFEVGNSGVNQTLDVPFQARYYRTGAITGGSVSSVATLTATYY